MLRNLASSSRELVIRRVIAEGGRTRVAINDHLASVQGLARLGGSLVQIYGQHEQQTLLQRENHIAILDRHAGLEADLFECRTLYERAPLQFWQGVAALLALALLASWLAR